jgi:hypothetical protein
VNPGKGASAALATPAAADAHAASGGVVSFPAATEEESQQHRAAREFAERLGARRRDAGAPVRTIFASDETVERPTLAQLLSGGSAGGGGRGGQLRVKLYLSLLWVCAKTPYDVARPARAWSALLGLPDPENRGVRRVQQTFRELQDRHLVRLEDRGGFPTRVLVLGEKGDGRAYRPAPDAHSALLRKQADEEVLREHRYFRVPSSLWTDGHIAKLGGPGLAMLLAVLSERRGQSEPGVWFSPARATARFGFAASTRSQGLAELRALGLLRTTIRTVSENGAYIDFARRRSVHEIVGL